MPSLSPHLPPGLSPVAAGRWGLWLLGRLSHNRAKHRAFVVSPRKGANIVCRFLNLMLPWSVDTYPGHKRALAEMCGGVCVGTVDQWMYVENRLPVKRALRLAEICEAQAAAYSALGVEFREYAERRTATMQRPRNAALGRSRRGG